MGNADGDPRYATLEARLASLPKISVPATVIHGAGVLGSSLIEEQEHGSTHVGITIGGDKRPCATTKT